jgi:aspartate/methionine/tyrosine aminotransferase
MRELTTTTSAASIPFSATGWRIGWIDSPEALPYAFV